MSKKKETKKETPKDEFFAGSFRSVEVQKEVKEKLKSKSSPSNHIEMDELMTGEEIERAAKRVKILIEAGVVKPDELVGPSETSTPSILKGMDDFIISDKMAKLRAKGPMFPDYTMQEASPATYESMKDYDYQVFRQTQVRRDLDHYYWVLKNDGAVSEGWVDALVAEYLAVTRHVQGAFCPRVEATVGGKTVIYEINDDLSLVQYSDRFGGDGIGRSFTDLADEVKK